MLPFDHHREGGLAGWVTNKAVLRCLAIAERALIFFWAVCLGFMIHYELTSLPTVMVFGLHLGNVLLGQSLLENIRACEEGRCTINYDLRMTWFTTALAVTIGDSFSTAEHVLENRAHPSTQRVLAIVLFSVAVAFDFFYVAMTFVLRRW